MILIEVDENAFILLLYYELFRLTSNFQISKSPCRWDTT